MNFADRVRHSVVLRQAVNACLMYFCCQAGRRGDAAWGRRIWGWDWPRREELRDASRTIDGPSLVKTSGDDLSLVVVFRPLALASSSLLVRREEGRCALGSLPGVADLTVEDWRSCGQLM